MPFDDKFYFGLGELRYIIPQPFSYGLLILSKLIFFNLQGAQNSNLPFQ